MSTLRNLAPTHVLESRPRYNRDWAMTVELTPPMARSLLELSDQLRAKKDTKMDASQLLDDLSARIYEPPLSDYRDDGRISDTTRPLSVVMLLVDYETECSMNGIVGFLGNSAGSRLTETITAVGKIGCIDHAKVLEEIRQAATAAGMTHDAIQDDCTDLQEFAVTSFADLHGDKWEDACDTISNLHENVDWDSFWKATLEFVRNHMDSILLDSSAP